MRATNPIPNSLPRKLREGSPLRDDRDADSLGQQWLKQQVTATQAGNSARALASLQRQVDRLRNEREPTPYPQLHPFQLYQLPGKEGTDLWRVHTGYFHKRRRYVELPSPSTVFEYSRHYNEVKGVANCDGVADWVVGGTDCPYLLEQAVDPGTGSAQTLSAFDFDLSTADIESYPTGGFGYFLWVQLTDETTSTPGVWAVEVKASKLDGTTDYHIYDICPNHLIGVVYSAYAPTYGIHDRRWRVIQYLHDDIRDVPAMASLPPLSWVGTYEENRVYYPGDMVAYTVGALTYGFMQISDTRAVANHDVSTYEGTDWGALFKMP